MEVGRGLPTAICLCPQAGNESQERVGSPSAPIQHRPSLFGGWTVMSSLTLQEAVDHRATIAKATLNTVIYINKAQPPQRGKRKPFLGHCFVYFLCYTVLLLWLSPLFSALGAWQTISPFIQSFPLSSSSSYPKVTLARQGEGGEDS